MPQSFTLPQDIEPKYSAFRDALSGDTKSVEEHIKSSPVDVKDETTTIPMNDIEGNLTSLSLPVFAIRFATNKNAMLEVTNALPGPRSYSESIVTQIIQMLEYLSTQTATEQDRNTAVQVAENAHTYTNGTHCTEDARTKINEVASKLKSTIAQQQSALYTKPKATNVPSVKKEEPEALANLPKPTPKTE